MSYNPAENSVLIVTRTHNTDNSIYDYYQVPKGDDTNNSPDSPMSNRSQVRIQWNS